MCTLTFIPKDKTDYIITSNRDESPSRPALKPQIEFHFEQKIILPKDPRGGGSWIAVNEAARTHVLLNGAFEPHHHRPPYGHSRGLILTRSYAFSNLKEFLENYILNNIEPFTLVCFHAREQIEELRWDGKEKHYTTFSPEKSHIWSAAMLYKPFMRREREKWFAEFLEKNSNPQPDHIMDFHRNGGREAAPEYSMCMDRGVVKTVSTSQIMWSKGRVDFQYSEHM